LLELRAVSNGNSPLFHFHGSYVQAIRK
jgi:hypothetical protein